MLLLQLFFMQEQMKHQLCKRSPFLNLPNNCRVNYLLSSHTLTWSSSCVLCSCCLEGMRVYDRYIVLISTLAWTYTQLMWDLVHSEAAWELSEEGSWARMLVWSLVYLESTRKRFDFLLMSIANVPGVPSMAHCFSVSFPKSLGWVTYLIMPWGAKITMTVS